MDFLENDNKKQGWKELLGFLYFLLAAFIILSFASRSSFLYPCNDWNDANSYFSVGKALFHGKVPYRDVFDQKGMYLYFFYGLAYLVSHTTFRGVFIMEILLAVFDLAGIAGILQLYVKKSTALVFAPLALAGTFASYSFYYGGSAEEICLPFLIWGLYLSLHYFKKEYPAKAMKSRTLFVAGILAGMVANIKFTVLGFFFAFMMCIAFSFLTRKDFFGAVKACLIFLGGMGVTFLPWIVYFAVNRALNYWYWGYVYINVFAYSNLNGEGPGLYERIYTLAKILYWDILNNPSYFVFVIPGVAFELLCKGRGGKHRLLPKLNLLSLCFFLFLGIYVGGSELPYYALPLSVFTVLGLVLPGKLIERFIGRRFLRVGLLSAAGCILSLCISVGLIYAMSMNTPFMEVQKKDHFLYKFKDIVEQDQIQDPSLLNIGCLDAGLYTVCDIVPSCQWFQTQTVIMDTVLSEQERYIREGQIDYVIARDSCPEVIWDRYELVSQELWNENDMTFTYYLFKKKQ